MSFNRSNVTHFMASAQVLKRRDGSRHRPKKWRLTDLDNFIGRGGESRLQLRKLVCKRSESVLSPLGWEEHVLLTRFRSDLEDRTKNPSCARPCIF